MDDEKTENDNAWEKLFETTDMAHIIQQQGCYKISSKELRKYREPRLMVNFPSKKDIPKILRDNQLNILPIQSRGNYLIGHFNTFITSKPSDYNQKIEINTLGINRQLDTLKVNSITREPSAILTAYNYGALAYLCDCNNEELVITNYGRTSTPEFEFTIENVCGGDDYNIKVERSQLEMDAVFESHDYVVNIEAKIGPREDFIGRQLFYPYNYLSRQTDKEIINVLLTYTAGSIFTYVYKIKDPSKYNSFKMEKALRFDLYETISFEEIQEIISKSTIIEEPDVPFPQANSVERIIDCLEIINNHTNITAKQLANVLDVQPRQGSYYGDACVYLGLCEKNKYGSSYKYKLSQEGQQIIQMNLKYRMLRMVELIARHDVFNRFLTQYIETAKPPRKEEIEYWLAHNTMRGMEMSTVHRRASTVQQWMNWVIQLSD